MATPTKRLRFLGSTIIGWPTPTDKEPEKFHRVLATAGEPNAPNFYDVPANMADKYIAKGLAVLAIEPDAVLEELAAGAKPALPAEGPVPKSTLPPRAAAGDPSKQGIGGLLRR